ncbi:MAG: hypothetical protein ABL996_24860, partial [Micropepsaceae bacterium]
NNHDSIDDLVMWLRDLFEDIALEDQLESEFDLVLPLIQKISASPGLVTNDDWKTAMRNLASAKKFELEFTLKDEHLLGRKRSRIKRIGISYGTDVFVEPSGIDRGATWESYCRRRLSKNTSVRRSRWAPFRSTARRSTTPTDRKSPTSIRSAPGRS